MISVFFSYSHRDEEYRDELETHLAALKRQSVIGTWHDRRIGAGQTVGHQISEHLEQSQIVLALVSSYFLASDYCYDIEMARALERHRAGEAVVIPVIVHPCDWKHTPFGQLRATPRDGKPISKHPNLHEAYLAVVEDIRKAAERFTNDPGPQPKPNISTHVPRTPLQRDRSSNLRVTREFTDKERDDFLDATFDYVANYFEESLNELGRRNAAIEARYKRVDLTHFTAAVYSSGVKRSSCRIWLGAPFGSGIAYSASDSGSDGGFNEILRVEDDGYSLVLEPMMRMGYSGTTEETALTKQGAAEALWSRFIGPLQ